MIWVLGIGSRGERGEMAGKVKDCTCNDERSGAEQSTSADEARKTVVKDK